MLIENGNAAIRAYSQNSTAGSGVQNKPADRQDGSASTAFATGAAGPAVVTELSQEALEKARAITSPRQPSDADEARDSETAKKIATQDRHGARGSVDVVV